MVAHRQIVVAMEAFERAPAGHLNGHLERHPLPQVMLVNESGKVTVFCRLHAQSFAFYFSQNPLKPGRNRHKTGNVRPLS
jgi:hypothetical protein